MKKELKQVIINFIFDNEKDYQLKNNTIKEFGIYIYKPDGNYLIGGEDVSDFIGKAISLITSKNN